MKLSVFENSLKRQCPRGKEDKYPSKKLKGTGSKLRSNKGCDRKNKLRKPGFAVCRLQNIERFCKDAQKVMEGGHMDESAKFLRHNNHQRGKS